MAEIRKKLTNNKISPNNKANIRTLRINARGQKNKLHYEFSNVFVAQSDFGKKNDKNFTHLDASYLKSIL